MVDLVTPLLVTNTDPIKAIRTNMAQTSKLNGTVTWVAIAMMGVALITMVVFLMRYKLRRKLPGTFPTSTFSNRSHNLN